MSTQHRCKTCGVPIQENTAEATGGLCRPCKGGYRLNIERRKRQGPVEVELVSITWKSMDEQTYLQRRRERAAAEVARCRARVAQSPTSAQAYFSLGLILHRNAHQYGDALSSYDQAIALCPVYPEALRYRAELLASCRDPALQDPARAVRDALAAFCAAQQLNQLHSDWVYRQYLFTLAQSYAANGDRINAVATLTRALPFANTRASLATLKGELARAQAGQRL
jgi:tetratricopeptide (TPR) repeat protein